ncbi:AraC family transcriptional regulator [Pseudomonas proteolytica]|uniref:helix-turn-helix domain-containing protein n=2 Tax=Pseudomonas TaxID=286 RepID=UPI0030EB9332
MRELSSPARASQETSASSNWTQFEGAAGTGTFQVERLDCEAGFTVIKSQMTAHKICAELCQHEGAERMLVIAFALSGQSEFRCPKGREMKFQPNQATVSIFREGQGQRVYAADTPIQQLRLVVTESALARFIGPQRCQGLLGSALGPHESFRQVACCDINPSEHLRRLKSPSIHQEDGLTQRIHALSLLSEQLQALEVTSSRQAKLTARDLDTLDRIDLFMQSNLDKPLNNAYLCTAMGVSEYRLKEYFRQVHGISPGRYLLELRMTRARELLAAGYRVSEVAYKVGYQHPNNLTAAFTRHFGHTPKSVCGNRVV